MEKEYDIIIVGAGPAGLSAAKSAVENGMKVLVVEEHLSIGSPVQCGEGSAQFILGDLGIDLDTFPSNQIKKVKIFSPNKKKIEMSIPLSAQSPFLIIERKMFEKQLAVMVSRLGADIFVNTKAVEVLKESDGIAGIKVLHFGKLIEIRARIVIGADGPNSNIARWSGLKVYREPEKFHSAIQFQMANIDVEPNTVEIHFGSFAPAGYAWIFSKGGRFANVGLGILSDEKKSALSYLQEFVSHDKRLRKGSIIEINGGSVPLGGVEKNFVGNRVIIVGDAARMVNPASGGGLRFAIKGGLIAGQVASRAVKGMDCSVESLKEFEVLWRKEFGKRFKAFNALAELLRAVSEQELDDIFEDIGTFTLPENFGKPRDAIGMIVKHILPAFLKRPKIMWRLRKVLPYIG